MYTGTKIISFIISIISTLNKNIVEHKYIERIKFWVNFKIWTELLFESKDWGFFEWYFLWLISIKTNCWFYNYNYKILNKVTWNLELCPIYNICWYIEK